jgi:hypothetical protein
MNWATPPGVVFAYVAGVLEVAQQLLVDEQ